MKYAIIGSGDIGTALARLFAKNNLEVALANSRGPETLAALTKELGPSVSARSAQDAAQAEVVFLAVPFPAHRDVAKLRPDWQGRIVVDATNILDNPEEEVPGVVSSEIVARAFPGARVVKAFNHLPARQLGTIRAGDSDLAANSLDQECFIQHCPSMADGVEGLKQFIGNSAPSQRNLTVVRVLEDGPFVVAQLHAPSSGRDLFVVYRFEGGLIAEHWAFSAPAGPPNQSGHTQLDGPTEPKHLEDTAKNKAFLRGYYETFHLAGDHHTQNDRYFTGDVMIRHEPGVRDGLTNFLRDVSRLMRHRTIDEIRLLLGQGDLVFIAARGTHEGEPCLYIDLYRIEDAKIVEHWGFPEKVPPQAEWKNPNGML